MTTPIVNDTIQSSVGGDGKSAAKYASIFDRVLIGCLHATVFLIPLWFLPFTLDVLELNKQTLLVVLAMVALLAWLGKSLLTKSFTLSRSWLHVVVGVFVAGYLVSAAASQDRFLSFVGNFGQMQWAFSTVLALAIFYLVAVNFVKDTTRLYSLLLTFLGSAALTGFFGLLQFLGMHPFSLFLGSTVTNAFSTIGTPNALAVYMAVAVVISSSLLVLGCKNSTCLLGGQKGAGSQAAAALVWATLVIGLIVAIVVDYWVVWAALLFGTLLVFAITTARTRTVKRSTKLVVPGLICLLSIVLLIWQTPIKLGLPGEVSPSPSHSWQIAQGVLKGSPFFGSGPGTWIYDYSLFRAPSVNLSQFWSIRFDHAFSSMFTLLATLGVVGFALWLILLASAVVKSYAHLTTERDDDEWQAYLTVFSGWATIAFVGFFYNYNMAQHFLFWFLLALLAALVAKGSYKWDAVRQPLVSTGLSVFFLVLAVGAISVTWLAGQRLVADADYSSAIVAFRAGQVIQTSIDDLNGAVALNSMNDSYYRNLSQAYILRANQVLQGQDADKATKLNQLVSAAVDTAKRASEVSPANVDNWSNLATVYQAITSFTRGADEFAISNYEEALKREPNNPIFSNEIGKLHILRADAYGTLLSSKDEKVRADAEANVKTELDKAAEELNQAILVKGDYAPAHYNLGIMYERQGRIKDAITKLEQVLSVSNNDVGVAFQLAILYYRDGQKSKAQSLLEQILVVDSTYVNARWYLSALYAEIGRLDDAIAQLQTLQKTYPGNTTISDRLTQLVKQRGTNTRSPSAGIPEPIKETITGPGALNQVQP